MEDNHMAPISNEANSERTIVDEPMEAAKKPAMTHEERMELAAKLDADLENFLSGLEKRRYTEGWPEDRWQEEMEKHPFFMTKFPEEGEEMPPLIQGLQQLKYDETENTPTELAIAYKDDGNFYFKCRKYRSAILGYTEGLRKKCGDPEIEAQLYNNRAAAHFFLKNWRSCIVDCQAALRLKTDYAKVRSRLAQCHYKLSHWDECLTCVDEILKQDKDNAEAEDLRKRTVLHKKIEERDKRKQDLQESKMQKDEEKLLAVIKERGIRLVGKREEFYPGAVQTQVHLVDERLVWPVMFLYPEVATSDLVQEFHEDSTFGEQLQLMFETPPGWDVEQQYRLDCLHVYYENKDKETLHGIQLTQTLGQVLALKSFVVYGGTPSFLVVVAGSTTEARLIGSYNHLGRAN